VADHVEADHWATSGSTGTPPVSSIALNRQNNKIIGLVDRNHPTRRPDVTRGSVKEIAVIVVNYNAGAYLGRCLRALAEQRAVSFDVVVVDNGSTDGSLEHLGELPSHFSVLRAGRNLGFAAANNLGLRESRSEWVALLNPDAFPDADWLSRLLAAARRRSGFDVFASRTVLADRPERLDGAGDVYHVSGLFWRRGHGADARQRFLDEEEVFCACAAAALYRRSALEAVGGFDEDYFCYAEDVDLGFRLRLAGFRCLYVPDAVVAHVASAITGRRSDFSIYHGHRNLVWTYVKNMPTTLFWCYLPLHLLLNVLTLVWFAVRGQARVIGRAKWDAVKALPQVWRKRRQVQETRCTTVRELHRVMSAGWAPKR
jgi:GT2 family glycosyltransferase